MDKVPAEVFAAAVKRYIQTKIIPSLPTSLDQFLASSGLLKFDAGFAKVVPVLERLGFAEGGQVDVASLDAHMRAGFEGVTGGKVSFFMPSAKTLAKRLLSNEVAQAGGGNWISDVLLSMLGLGSQDIGEGLKTTLSLTDWEELRALI